MQKLYKSVKKYQKNRTFLKKFPKYLIISIIFFTFFRSFYNINKVFYINRSLFAIFCRGA